jgi:hypothetical protein
MAIFFSLWQAWLFNTFLLKFINRRNSQSLPAQHADICPDTLYYQQLLLYFCAALTVMQSFKVNSSMNENLKDRDILLVREKGSNELKVAEMDKDGMVAL